jgi:hypothetical protein
MTMATSILVQARTEGGLTAGPVGSRQARAQVGIPSMASNQATATDASVPESQELDEASVSLNASLPGNVAVLVVQAHAIDNDRWAFSLQGLSSIEGIDGFGPTEPIAQPDVVLADLAQDVNPAGTAPPSQILGIMHGFSQENRKVPWWVNKMRAATGDDLHLIIIDYTGFEIPWELLTLPPGESGIETYLGTAVSTARWQPIYDARTFEDRPLQWTHEELAGHIAAFVDEQELKGGGKEMQVLTELHATVDNGLKELTNRLARSEAGFGLVYLACHGQPADTPVNFALGSLSATGYRLVLSKLQAMKLQLFGRSKAIVFINACHSGRMRKDNKYLRTQYLRGFPEAFLSKGAVGVIGTTGFVNDAFATEMANWFLRELSTTEEPVSKLLRRWREKVLRELPAERSEKDDVALLNACMYVYYGNPQSRLRITQDPP